MLCCLFAYVINFLYAAKFKDISSEGKRIRNEIITKKLK